MYTLLLMYLDPASISNLLQPVSCLHVFPVTTISDPEKSSDTLSTAPSLAAKVSMRSTQNKQPEVAQAVPGMEGKAPHMHMGSGPYFPYFLAPTSLKTEPAVHQAVAMPKWQEDLVRIKADDQTDHRSRRSIIPKVSGPLETAKGFSSDWACNNSSRG